MVAVVRACACIADRSALPTRMFLNCRSLITSSSASNAPHDPTGSSSPSPTAALPSAATHSGLMNDAMRSLMLRVASLKSA